MPKLDSPEGKLPRHVPRSPEDRPIPAQNVCSLCLYNIPRGSLMIVFPGLAILVTGAIFMSLTETTDSWSSGMSQVALVLVIIGGALTLLGLIYWCIMWCKYKPSLNRKSKAAKKRSVSPDTPVELVAVYHISNKKNTDPAYQVSAPGPSGVIQVS